MNANLFKYGDVFEFDILSKVAKNPSLEKKNLQQFPVLWKCKYVDGERSKWSHVH